MALTLSVCTLPDRQATEELIALLRATEADVIRTVTASHDDRVKVLDAHIAELAVSADQLRFAGAACTTARLGVCVSAPVLQCRHIQAMLCAHNAFRRWFPVGVGPRV